MVLEDSGRFLARIPRPGGYGFGGFRKVPGVMVNALFVICTGV